MNLSELFGWNKPAAGADELPDIFPMPVAQSDFVRTDIVSIYGKILTDVLERTHGLNEDQIGICWDSCVKSSSSDGLITRFARGMSEKQDMFLVYEKAVGVVRPATQVEMAQIKTDYETQGESSVGVFISFKNFSRSDMVKFYLSLEFLTVGSLHKSMNLSKAVQIKIADLRASVSLVDQDGAKSQAQAIAKSLGAGKDVLLDAKDTIETSIPNLSAVKESISFLVKKLSFYLGLPESYLVGEQTAGIGSTGENDLRAVERGLKSYYFSILKPAFESLFGVKTSYKSQDFRQIASSSEILKTFALVDDSLVSAENKRRIVNRLLDLPEEAVAT